MPTQAPDVSLRARYQQLVCPGSECLPLDCPSCLPLVCPSFLPPLWALWAQPCTERQHGAATPAQARAKHANNLGKGRMIIDRAFLFQEVTAAVSRGRQQEEPTLNTPPPTHTRAKGTLGCMLDLVFRWAPASPSQHVAWPASQGPSRGPPKPRTVSTTSVCPLSDQHNNLGSSLDGQRGLLHGLRMAARLFRLGPHSLHPAPPKCLPIATLLCVWAQGQFLRQRRAVALLPCGRASHSLSNLGGKKKKKKASMDKLAGFLPCSLPVRATDYITSSFLPLRVPPCSLL